MTGDDPLGADNDTAAIRNEYRRTITDTVFDYPADAFGFNGCTDRNPDVCACGQLPPACAACGEAIDGEASRGVTQYETPWLAADDPDNEWSHTFWHVRCDEYDPTDFPATPAGIVAGSDSSGLPATPKPHH